MQEDLIGYLLGALEPDEMRRVEAWLLESEDARQQLAELESALRGLDDPEPIEPPPLDLVARTLASLPPMPTEADETPAHSEASPADDAALTQLSPVSETGSGSNWSWRDWCASVTAAAIVIAIALPAMLEGRFVARKEACQDNLRELGVAMTQFVNRNAEQRLPSIAPSGYQAFAGMYAPRLREAGLLTDADTTLCPSLEREQFWPNRLGPEPHRHANPDKNSRPDVVTLALLDEVGRDLISMTVRANHDEASNAQMLHAIEKLRWMQTTAGGHYSYSLGVRDGDYFASPRFRGRSAFAVMSDAVIMQNGRVVHDGRRATPSLISHGGRGINVLYEDGRVGFMPREALSQIPDHPLFNHAGQIEAGVTIDDASLAPSWQPPFIQAVQR